MRIPRTPTREPPLLSAAGGEPAEQRRPSSAKINTSSYKYTQLSKRRSPTVVEAACGSWPHVLLRVPKALRVTGTAESFGVRASAACGQEVVQLSVEAGRRA